MRTSLAHRALIHDGRTRAERLRDTRARHRRARKTFGSAILAVVMSIPLVLAVSGGATANAAPVSVFSGFSAPNTVSSDVNAVELGMKFRSSVAGTVTAISYFKATGAPVATKSGHLWSATGQLLASVLFSNETASGWQQAALSSPVDIAAATTYVVSYYAPKGGYTSTHNYFTTTIVNGPLTVPATGNDVFCYARAACFPNQTYTASNYYVDLVFVPATDPVTAPTTVPSTLAPSTVPTTTPAPTSTVATTTTTQATTTTTAATTTTTATSTSTTTLPATTTTTVPPSGGQTLNCAPAPHLCGFPDETNTGVPAGVVLTQVPSQATSGPGWSCSGTNCSGGVTITGNVGSATTGLVLADGITARVPSTTNGVTITNLKILGVHGNYSAGITLAAGSRNVAITNCEIQGAAPSDGFSTSRKAMAGVLGINSSPAAAASITVDHCNIHGFSTGIYFEVENGSDVVTNNFIHGETCWDYTHNIDCLSSQSQYGGSAYTDHLNDFQSGGGPGTSGNAGSLLLQNNTLWQDGLCCTSDTIAMFNDSGTRNLQTNAYARIDHNLVSGAGNCIAPGYGGSGGPGVPSYVAITNMHYSTKYGRNCGSNAISYFDPAQWPKQGSGDYQCGSVWDDGAQAGSGADQSNTYPTAMKPVVSCTGVATW